MNLTESKQMLTEAERQGAIKIMIPVSELKFMLQQVAKVEEMQKALEWYADRKNYEQIWTAPDDNEMHSSADSDQGIKARKALKGVETK